jgi:ABC-type transporter MlaC component
MSKISIAALTIAVMFSLSAAAGDAANPNFTPRQMAHCVMHRVKDSPSESYKAAIRACKEEFDSAASNERDAQTAMNNANAAAGSAR